MPARSLSALRRHRAQILDVGVVAVACVVDLFIFSTLTTSYPSSPPIVVVGSALLGNSVLLLRRRFPVPVFVFCYYTSSPPSPS